MLIALTGTPGTGKTTVAKLLKKMGYRVVHLNIVVKKEKLYKGFDEKRKSYIVDLKKVGKYIKKLKNESVVILDSHISHLLDVDYVIVLRCDPSVLEKRLKKRRWKKEKIRENVEAELVEVIPFEVEERFGDRFVEIDTTRKKPETVAKEIKKILKGLEKDGKNKNSEKRKRVRA